jgi:preprotein translocase subunit SecE
MAMSIYKPDQGYWTRLLTAVGVGVLVLAGVAWLVKQLSVLRTNSLLYIQAGVAVGIIIAAAAGLFVVLNSPRVVDFMIATEAEMRKVSWPTRKEIIGSTWVVICGTFLLAAFMFLMDLVFAETFTLLGVLENQSALVRLYHTLFG